MPVSWYWALMGFSAFEDYGGARHCLCFGIRVGSQFLSAWHGIIRCPALFHHAGPDFTKAVFATTRAVGFVSEGELALCKAELASASQSHRKKPWIVCFKRLLSAERHNGLSLIFCQCTRAEKDSIGLRWCSWLVLALASSATIRWLVISSIAFFGKGLL